MAQQDMDPLFLWISLFFLFFLYLLFSFWLSLWLGGEGSKVSSCWYFNENHFLPNFFVLI